jgi:hypothetical protein
MVTFASDITAWLTPKADGTSALLAGGAPVCDRLGAFAGRFGFMVTCASDITAWLTPKADGTSALRFGALSPPGHFNRPNSSRKRALLHGHSLASRAKPALAGLFSM